MSPVTEAEAETRSGARVVRAREVADEVRDEARRLHLDLLIRISATQIGGTSLRQALRDADGLSRWWFVRASEKNTIWPGDTYADVVRLLCVARVAERKGLRRIRLVGAPASWEAVLRPRFEIEVECRGAPAPSTPGVMARGVAARCAMAARYLRLVGALGRMPAAAARADVLLQSYWDWSLGPGPEGVLRDGYFADLPDRLRRRGLGVGWLAWCEPRTTPSRRRPLASVLAGAAAHPEVVLAERYLTPRDVLAAAFDFRWLRRYREFAARPAFRRLFLAAGLDFHPLLAPALIAEIAGAGIPRLTLLALAAERACSALQPRVVLTFLEALLHSRAVYAGARRACPGVRLWSAQHASYCRDKTFGVFDGARELHGEPDGCPLPAPDGIFVMGTLSEKIWRANGYPDDAVVVTGGLRYLDAGRPHRRGPGQPMTVLIGASMLAGDELDLCEAAVEAVRGLPVRLRLRDHPYANLSERPAFQRFRDAIEVTTGTADEDLDASDLLLFSHSGLAEEALVRGVPAWRWMGSGVNTSVFLDVPVVPGFASIGDLRRGLEAFVANPAAYRPAPELRARVMRECFGPAPQLAAAVVADHVAALAGADGPPAGAALGSHVAGGRD